MTLFLPQKVVWWLNRNGEMGGSVNTLKLSSSWSVFEVPISFGQMNVTNIYAITNKINIQVKVQKRYKGEGMLRKYLALDF